jgi:MinD superfamily P-loop ATPase
MKIDKNLCDICGTCASVCPNSLITIKEFEVILNNENCDNCQKCSIVCPAEAISED